MDAFLAQVGSEGLRDSRGVFTINAEKAEIKLAKFQLADLKEFPKFLLAAATAGGATGLDVSFAKKKTRVLFRGWSITTEDLRAIGTASLKKETPRRLRYLATVLSCIGSRYRFAITGRDFFVRFADGVLQFPEERPPVGEPDSMVIEFEAYLREKLMMGLTGQQKFCSFPIKVGDIELGRGYDPSTETLDSFGFVSRQGDRLPELSLKYGNPRTHLELPPQEGAPALALGMAPPAIAWQCGLWLLVDELACRAPRDFGPNGFYGVVIAQDLSHDLSYRLNRNEAYHAVESQIAEACRQLCRHLRPEYGSLLAHQKESLERAFRQLDLSWSAPRATARTRETEAAMPREEATILLEELRFERLAEDILNAVRSGRISQALETQRTHRELGEQLGRASQTHTLIELLLEDLESDGESASNKLGYLKALRDWTAGRQVDPNVLEDRWIHPSWLWPLGLVTEDTAGWMELLTLLERGQITEALQLVRTHTGLGYENHQRCWLQYFWDFHQGQLSWSETIKLRVALSFSNGAETPDYRATNLSDLRQSVLLQEPSRAPFWPHLLRLLKRNEGSETAIRECWSTLLKRVLVERYLDPAVSDPLSKPFAPGSAG